ncbi:MAG: M64 family metallopeptidase [Nanoarchaeota archaeon]|nr:M64 family metallopeptidase [Nanoarchaeota archaeon]
MKKWIIFGSIVLIMIIAVVFYFNFKNSEPLMSDLEECKTFSYNGENAINILFFSNKKTVEEYSKFFLESSPFKDYQDSFNFFYIDTYKPECEIYKDIAILCNSEEIIKKSSSCPNDYVIVIKTKDKGIRSSAYMNIMSLNSNHPKTVLLHEFGHAFASLADEYVPSTLPKNSKNCVTDCSEFKTETNGCFLGCSKLNYFRSIEYGVMGTLKFPDYGIFNEKIILENINKIQKAQITGKAIENSIDCSKEKYYLIQGIYENNNITEITKKTLESGCVGTNGNGEFKFNLISKDNKIIKTEEFNPEFIFTDAQGEEQINGEVLENKGDFYLKIPVIEELKSIEIKKENKKITEINMIGFDSKSRPCKK